MHITPQKWGREGVCGRPSGAGGTATTADVRWRGKWVTGFSSCFFGRRSSRFHLTSAQTVIKGVNGCFSYSKQTHAHTHTHTHTQNRDSKRNKPKNQTRREKNRRQIRSVPHRSTGVAVTQPPGTGSPERLQRSRGPATVPAGATAPFLAHRLHRLGFCAKRSRLVRVCAFRSDPQRFCHTRPLY